MLLFAVKDVKAGIFLQPFSALSNAEAMRQVTMAADDSKTTLHQFPTDFELFTLGSYNQESGLILSSVFHLENVSNLIRKAAANG